MSEHEHEHEIDPADLVGVMPESPDQLKSLVGSVLEAMIGSPIQTDEDGDFPIGIGPTLLFVRVPAEQPLIEIHGPMLEGIRLDEQAAEVLGQLNAEVDLIQFFVSEGNLIARAQLLASPFVRLQLITLLDHMAEALSQITPDVQEQIGGKPIDFEAE